MCLHAMGSHRDAAENGMLLLSSFIHLCSFYLLEARDLNTLILFSALHCCSYFNGHKVPFCSVSESESGLQARKRLGTPDLPAGKPE